MNSKLRCLMKSEKVKRLLFYLAVIFVTVFLDQITKYITAKSGKSFQIVSDLLMVVPVKNNGMAFGMLGEWKHAQAFFIAFTIIILILVTIFLVKTKNHSKTLHSAIALLIGGTLGNFIDRVIWREVRDFIALDLRIPILQFNCNVADIFITAGAVVLFVYLLFIDKDAIFRKKTSADASIEEKVDNSDEQKAENCDKIQENTVMKNNGDTEKNEDNL